MLTWRERLQLALGPGMLAGITAGDWLAALRQNRIDFPYWARAASVTEYALLASLLRRYEDRKFLTTVTGVRVKPPIFVLGHWRSGTTHLHNLLAVDQRLAYPNLYHVLFPHTFLCTERYGWALLRPFLEKRRPLDGMAQDFHMPNEDEVALCNLTGLSSYMGFVFPRRRDYYDRYLTFRQVPDDEVERWKSAFTLFLQKLTWKYDRPLILKSPPHTCRIRLLLELFPDARFVHVHRNPYVVFRSTAHADRVGMRWFGLQGPDLSDQAAYIIRRYRAMYDAFFAEKGLIPAENFHEVSLEDIEREPIRQMGTLYEKLRLPDFQVVEPALRQYVGSLHNYRKNEYPELPADLRREIGKAWERCFDEWGYSRSPPQN
jgi:omega-hydroxy-beta-dihydromenaquinone-9 sulfotransferase